MWLGPHLNWKTHDNGSLGCGLDRHIKADGTVFRQNSSVSNYTKRKVQVCLSNRTLSRVSCLNVSVSGGGVGGSVVTTGSSQHGTQMWPWVLSDLIFLSQPVTGDFSPSRGVLPSELCSLIVLICTYLCVITFLSFSWMRPPPPLLGPCASSGEPHSRKHLPQQITGTRTNCPSWKVSFLCSSIMSGWACEPLMKEYFHIIKI